MADQIAFAEEKKVKKTGFTYESQCCRTLIYHIEKDEADPRLPDLFSQNLSYQQWTLSRLNSVFPGIPYLLCVGRYSDSHNKPVCLHDLAKYGAKSGLGHMFKTNSILLGDSKSLAMFVGIPLPGEQTRQNLVICAKPPIPTILDDKLIGSAIIDGIKVYVCDRSRFSRFVMNTRFWV